MKPQETRVESTVRRQLGPGGATRESSASNPGSKPSHKTASPELQARIAERAYNLYEKRGHQAGQDLEDWLQAEREVLQQEEAKQIGRVYRQELWKTGKSATMTGTDILRITGGKIQEVCINWDSLGLLQQLGVAQLRSQAAAR